VVERPRGFESHTPRQHLNIMLVELKSKEIVESEDFFCFLLESIRQCTAKTYVKRLKLLAKIGNLDSPERIKNLICTYQCSESFKELLTNAYDYYVRYRGLSWSKPKFTKEDKPIFVPLEKELDQLISKARIKLGVFLELLKETGVDSGEAWKLRWIDVNSENKTVDITPTKNHNARTLPISNHLLSRLFKLKHENGRVFACKSLDDFRRRYEDMKNALSVKLNNPRIKHIAFRSFRHWKATMEYQKTKDILHVKWLLGHKRIENTLVYTHLVKFGKDDYVCKVAKTVQEATALIENGFEYVTEMEGVKLFRKRK
jgi:integrase